MPICKSDLARLNKAKAAMKLAENADYASRGLRDARKLLKPLVEKNIAEAQYLAGSFALANEFESDAAFEKWRYDLFHKAAESGYATAQFSLGQAYDQGGDLEYEPKNLPIGFHFQRNKPIPAANGSMD